MRKRTKNQELVFQVLNHSETPMSAYDILGALKDDGFRAPLQVYRALDRLLADRLVHRLETLNAYVACRHSHDHRGGDGAAETVMFMICDSCGRTGEIDSAAIADQLTNQAQSQDFMVSQTVVEMRGQCRPCAEAAQN